MITLKTLEKATAQEVFDQVANHLLTQQMKANSGNSCHYRSSNGLKCAAGCLMADDEYFSDMEGHAWGSLVHQGLVTDKHSYLIERLQFIHDHEGIKSWENCLKNVAERNNLNYK